MCLSPCTVASEFSIFRATSVSSCDGDAPGSAAAIDTVGRSMSGKFCTFMAWKASSPANVSSTNSITAGIGLRIDQDETFSIAAPSLARRGGGRRGGGGRVHHADRVAFVEEAAARGDQARVGRQAVHDLDAVAR